MVIKAFSGPRRVSAAWLALPACILAIAAGGAHVLFESGAVASTERRSPVVSGARPADGARVRPATNPEGASIARQAPRATAPSSAAQAKDVVAASVLRELREFSSSDAEVTFLRARLPGAKLEHENWTRSLATMKKAVGQAASASERAELERRSALLETKLAKQGALLAQIEGRIETLERSGGFVRGAR